jgi:hypothetical protein
MGDNDEKDAAAAAKLVSQYLEDKTGEPAGDDLSPRRRQDILAKVYRDPLVAKPRGHRQTPSGEIGKG